MIDKSIINSLTATKNLFIVFCLLTLKINIAQAQTINKTSVYVWDFKVNASEIKKYADKFTDDFETELIKLDKYKVLQRRNHNVVLAHREMENSILDIKNLPNDAVNKLKDIRAENVIFGQLIEDKDSGIYEVSVLVQNLENGEIQKKESIIIEKALIRSNLHRKQYMKDLIDKLHAKEILLAKNEQFSIISKTLDTYIVKVKDVKIAFKDIIDIALKREEYFKELEGTINAYNEIFVDLNDNSEKYILDFESVWGAQYGKELEVIYHEILSDIHKKYILKLNNIRKKIWDYRGNELSRKEKEQVRKDIINDTKNSTLGLNVAIDKVEDQTERLYLNLKQELRTE